jgi:peptidyl-prolyl cis-trans isomerase A (cyclophilin A)
MRLPLAASLLAASLVALLAIPSVARAAKPWGPPKGKAFIATLRTSEGDVRCILRHEHAPETVRNFVELAQGKRAWIDPRTGEPSRKPLYSGTVFHRVIPDFMIQGGDPLGDGTGGPGYTFPDEGGARNTFARSGLLAMANRGPDTNGSQFFLTDAPAPHLDGLHTVFGDCGNPEVIRRIARVEPDAGDRPVTPVVLERVVISVQ